MRKPTVRRSLLPDGILKQTDKKHIGIDQNIEEIVPFQRSPRSILTRALFRKNLPSDEASFKPYSICYPFFDIARYYPLLCAGMLRQCPREAHRSTAEPNMSKWTFH